MTTNGKPNGKLADKLETVGKAGRLLTPAIGLAILTIVFQGGQTLASLNDKVSVGCENTATVAAALHYEHVHAHGQLHRFAPIFPLPKRC